MTTIAEQLTQLNAVKQNFKTKFTAKGVDMTGIPFTAYPSLLDEIGRSGEVISVAKYYTTTAATTYSNTITLDEPVKIKQIVHSGLMRMNGSTYKVEVYSGSTLLCSGQFVKGTAFNSYTVPPIVMDVNADIEVSELTVKYTFVGASSEGNGNIFEVYTVLSMLVGVDDESSSDEASWVTKTGYYNQMTAANTPFTVTTSDTAHFNDAYTLFDEDWTTNPTFNVSFNLTIEQDLLEAKIIPTKIEVLSNVNNGDGATFSGTNTITVSSDGVTWKEFGTSSLVEHALQNNTVATLENYSLTEPIQYVRLKIDRSSSCNKTQTGGNGFRIVEWKEYVAGSNNNDKTWVAKTGALAVLPESFTTTQASGSTGGSAGSEIFKFDSPIRNFNGHMVIKGSGGDATYRQFGINVECYLDSTCSQSNMIKTGFNHTQTTSETTFNFSLGDDIEIYGIKYTIWSADASNNISNVGTTTCTEAMITSWEELVGGSGSSGGSYIPAGIEAIYNTSWEALAGAGNSPYTSKVFDSGNNNKKGAYLCIRNALKAIVYGSNDQSDWQPVISGNTGGSNDGATGTPKNLVSEEVDYRYFKATCTGYNNGHPTTVSWGVFEASGNMSYKYPNHTVKYGQLQSYEVSTTKSDANRVITFPDGIIPLTLSIDLKFGATNSESHRRFTIDGLFYANHGGLNGIANSDFVQSDIDLESYYGDISAIPSSLTYYGWSTEANREVKGTITITKWLEPSSGSGNDTGITTKTQQLSQKTNTLNGGETQTLTFTFSDLSQVLGITDISGCVEYVWLKSMAINGNVVTAVVGNNRVSGNGTSTTITLTAIGTGSDTAQPTWVSKTGTLASSSVSGKFNPAWQTDDVVKTQTIDLSSPTKVTSVYLYSGTRRVDNNGWCNGRVTLIGKTASGSTVTLLNKYTDFGRNGKTVELNNDSELVSVTWTWYTPDSTYRDYNVNQNGSISAWQVQE